MLVLEGAPVETVASAALWAAFAAGGRHPAAAGRLVCVPSVAEPLLGAAARARRCACEVGDPASEQAEVGPLRSAEDLADRRGARRGGGRRRRRADLRRRHARRGPRRRRSTRPPCCGACPPARGSCASPCPGPVLAVVEAPGEAAAIALVQDGPAGERPHDRRARGGVVSIWAARPRQGRARRPHPRAELTWVNEHGAVAPGPALRLQRHVAPRQVASRPALIGGARRLPYDPAPRSGPNRRHAAGPRPRGRPPGGAPARRRAAGAGGAAGRGRAAAPALERRAVG